MIHNLKTSLPTVPDNESYRAGSHVLPENKPTGGVFYYGFLLFKYWIIITAKTFDYHKVERDLHKMYESKRINGEWFALTYDDIDNIIFYLNSNGIKAKRMDTTKSGCGFMENKGV